MRDILSLGDPPDCTRSEAAFDRLQANGKGVPEYGYDTFSSWKRGVERAAALLARESRLMSPGARVLEAACGDGMTGFALSTFGHDVVLCDSEDWRDERARQLPFLEGDITASGVLPKGRFDLVCSYNSFEHFADPAAALRELVGCCISGGLLYLEFGPLYSCPWGLHAYRTLLMPYPQFLFSRGFVDEKLAQLGIVDLGRRRSALQSVNGWRLRQFEALWLESGCEVLRYDVAFADRRHLAIVEEFPESFRGRHLTLEDLLAQSITVLLRRAT